MNWEIIQEPLRVMWINTIGFVPNLLAALVILLIGCIVARVVRYLVQRALKLVQLDKISEKAGINDALKQANLTALPSQVVAKLFYWIVMILALVIAVDMVKLTVATELLNRVLLYLPNVILAVFVLVLGFFFGSLLRGLVQTTLGVTKTMDPEVAGKVAQLAIILFAVGVSLEQLRIGTLITNAFNVAFAAIAFALALAFGLGCKDLVKGWVEGLLKK